jgi:hypothetical protein
MDVTKPYKLIGFGDIHGPKPCEFMGLDVHRPNTYDVRPKLDLRDLPRGSQSEGEEHCAELVGFDRYLMPRHP